MKKLVALRLCMGLMLGIMPALGDLMMNERFAQKAAPAA